MLISKRQRAKINSAVKPFKITSNYLGPGFQKLVKFYSKYFAKRRFKVKHFLPAYKNFRNHHFLTVIYHKFINKGGFAKKSRATTWTFYGNILLTKYGKRKQQKEAKNKRKISRQPKHSIKPQTKANQEKPSATLNKDDSNASIPILEQSNQESIVEQQETSTILAKSCTNDEALQNTCLNNANDSENAIEKSCFDDEAIDNIWNLDLQKVAALITDSGTDDKLSETDACKLSEKQSDESTTGERDTDSSGIKCIDEEPQDQSAKSPSNDINEKIRQQLKLLKMGKSENFLYTTKESRPVACTVNATSQPKQTASNCFVESKKSGINLKSFNKSPSDGITVHSNNNSNHCGNSKKTTNIQDVKSKTAVGGMIESLFNRFQSRHSNVGSTPNQIPQSKPLTFLDEYKNNLQKSPTPSPAKRPKRIEIIESTSLTTHDSNQDDSNQSAASVSMEFLGFDISNKNIDASALLPTPKVSASNSQAAFVSEYLDMFMRENSLEKSNDEILIVPKRCSQDEALITTDAQPPNLTVPVRPLEQRPRTLAEKRMIFQQQTDINSIIKENESTVYHELRKRTKQGTAYDSSLGRSFQDANIPFRRDCWRAVCWIATTNNRFWYRTINYDGKDIKLVGSRGNNLKKEAFKIHSIDSKPLKPMRYTVEECSKVCTPINDVKIHNLECISGNAKVNIKVEDAATQPKLSLLNKTRLNLFSREYLTPGPKSKKLKCKANRTSSFDLEYGPLELAQLPTVQLEVWPQINLPLPDSIKSILKTVPKNSNVITPEWAKFAVSVVRETPKQIKHRRKYRKPESMKPESIVFNISYENDEKKILIRKRRRSSITFSKDDAIHEQIKIFYQDDDKNEMGFARNIDPTDTLSIDCADILSNMIHSVAIAVNDSNFIKPDPDIDYVGKVVPISSLKDASKATVKMEKDKQSTKAESASKMKLIKELKRLNVTVIDTANELSKIKVEEVCQKPFCKLGCVCGSIDFAKYIQTHCRLYDCMFSCVCVDNQFKEPNSFYMNNNIDLLQAQANARLAKEEKEFKSTIIVSDNDMFVLPSSSIATKRHSKKPKRFTSDETCLDDTETETIFKSKRRRPMEKVVESYSGEDKYRNALLKKIQHVRVEVKKLPKFEAEPWCIVHCLYKCHCKGRALRGRIVNGANQKNDMSAPGGWEIISPRKRQYTFERENATGDEPFQKNRKLVAVEIKDPCEIGLSARTKGLNWKKRPRRSKPELKTLKNECMFVENQRADILKERITECRKYNQAQNMLNKSIQNGSLAALRATNSNAVARGNAQTITQSSNSHLHRLNNVITDTMHRLTALQERSQLILNPIQNKLSIVPWNRMLQAFKSHEIFVWDVLLKDNLRLLVLTTTHIKPKSDNFEQVTNIIYHSDISALPMVAKLLRNEFHAETTKYLAMILLRVTNYWRICGVLHSDVKYMDDELRAKPTPDQNPLLGRKINVLYQVLMNQTPPKTLAITSDSASTNRTNNETDNKTLHTFDAQSLTAFQSNGLDKDKRQQGQPSGTVKDDISVKKSNASDEKSFFENTSMRLSLPIQVTRTQRFLMLNLGDDFTHIWFQTWRKFLSLKRIQHDLDLAKKLGKTVKTSHSNLHPKVFVTSSHDNVIFIGPYGSHDTQNVNLFVKHDGKMLLSEDFHKNTGKIVNRKTKASWIYTKPDLSTNSLPSTAPLKINQVFSKLDMPSEFEVANSSLNEEDNPQTLSTLAIDPLSIQPAVDSSSRDINMSKPNVVCKPSKIPEFTPIRLTKANVIPKSNRNTSPLPFKISSVASGEGVEFLANGLDSDSIDKDTDSQPPSSDVEMENIGTNIEPDIKRDSKSTLTVEQSDANGVKNQKFPKIESIDISDDEQQKDLQIKPASNLSVKKQLNEGREYPINGFIYCSSNIQLGRLKAEWVSSNNIKLYCSASNETTDFKCDATNDAWQINLRAVSAYMQKYIRNRFYGVYPGNLHLEWAFAANDTDTASTLIDLDSVETCSVVFKDKVVHIKENYHKDVKLTVKQKYVTDIYKLASHFIPEDVVKTMKIYEIIKKCQQTDAELVKKQNECNRLIQHYKKLIDRYSSILDNKTEIQNGKI